MRAKLRRTILAAALLAATLLLGAGCTEVSDQEQLNILLIVMDTIRADHLSTYGYHRPTAPHISALAERGALFLQAHSVAPYTRASTASILTGLYPSVHNAITTADSISPQVPTLAERLREAGYTTAGIHRNIVVGERFGFGRGFETYVIPDDEFILRREQEGDPVRFISEMDDRLLTREAVIHLQGFDRSSPGGETSSPPFFLYLHFQGAHQPYAPPEDAPSFLDEPLTFNAELFYKQPLKRSPEEKVLLSRIRQRLLRIDEREMVALYDAELAFADQQVGAVLDVLAHTGLDDETLVIVTSDHGEEFWDHGNLGHGRSNYEEMLHIPLVIAGPGIQQRRIEEPVSLIDLTPTILDMAGLEPPADLPGRSLAAVLRSRRKRPEAAPIYAEGLARIQMNGEPLFFRSIQQGETKFIMDFRHKRKLFFDLSIDPDETTNLLAEKRAEARAFLDDLIALHQVNLDSPYLAPVDAAEVPEELAADLRALGYLGSQKDSTPSTSLFRRPLRRMDLDVYGFMGHEVDGASYWSQLDFLTPEFPEEQLLYGWGPRKPGRPVLLHLKAGARLKRDPGHRKWKLVGKMPAIEGRTDKLTLLVQIDGGEPQRRLIEGIGPFEVSGPLTEGERSYVRFDVTCEVDYTVAYGVRKDDLSTCVQISTFGIE